MKEKLLVWESQKSYYLSYVSHRCVRKGGFMKKGLSLSSYLYIGSMLFGLFFGAGNLIFPVHMGQVAGANVSWATIGFLVTGIGLPFLGVIAIGLSKSNGLFDLASRIHPLYGYFMTVALYLTIGPFFALPRLSTVSYEIGLTPYINPAYQTIGLAIFSILFYGLALFLSLKPTKILVYVGKVLNPIFLVFLGILILTAFIRPMGGVAEVPITGNYIDQPFVSGFLEGYNTMDALASLAFGIVVVQTIKNLGVTKPSEIAKDTIKSGLISIILMGIIYTSLSYLGTMSVGQFPISENGGIALAQISQFYFGSLGSVLLAVIVTVACLKTAIGLITACAETFKEMFPNSISYKSYVVVFSVLTTAVANIGLANIITYSLPVLMFLYPLAITLILLALLSPFFKNRQVVYISTTLFTLVVSIADLLNALPESIRNLNGIQGFLAFCSENLPFFAIGMGWILPASVGFAVGIVISLVTKPNPRVL